MAMTEVKSEPNLTPMLDMVFQLITFFMLVINFKAAEIDQNLSLPVVGFLPNVAVSLLASGAVLAAFLPVAAAWTWNALALGSRQRALAEAREGPVGAVPAVP